VAKLPGLVRKYPCAVPLLLALSYLRRSAMLLARQHHAALDELHVRFRQGASFVRQREEE
jgi:hypothetical protein